MPAFKYEINLIVFGNALPKSSIIEFKGFRFPLKNVLNSLVYFSKLLLPALIELPISFI